jgi:transcriptional regulator with XRE-family HTH domain
MTNDEGEHMTGHRPWKEIRGAADRDAEGEQRVYEQSLAELRRARAFTQAQLADALDVPQSQISRIEHQAELYISTLARYLEAMGGHLELVGVFGNQRIPLTLGDLTHSTSDTEGADAVDSEPLLTPALQS